MSAEEMDAGKTARPLSAVSASPHVRKSIFELDRTTDGQDYCVRPLLWYALTTCMVSDVGRSNFVALRLLDERLLLTWVIGLLTNLDLASLSGYDGTFETRGKN